MKAGRPNLEFGAARQRNNKTARSLARVPSRLDRDSSSRQRPLHSHISMWLSSLISCSDSTLTAINVNARVLMEKAVRGAQPKPHRCSNCGAGVA